MAAGRDIKGRSKGKREAGALTQSACSMTGFAFQLVPLSGELSVVIFGERDCANAFLRKRGGIGFQREWGFFTVAVNESDVIGGSAEQRLEECLREVAVRGRPIIVLSTCLTEMTGADPGPACRQVEKETGIKVVPLRTSGLRPRSQASIVDWFGRTMIDEFGRRGAGQNRGLNLVGYHFFLGDELRSLPPESGLTLNAFVPDGARLEDWAVLPGASTTVVPESGLYPGLCERLEGFGQEVIEVPLASGVRGMDEFHAALAASQGVDSGPLPAHLEVRENAVRSIARARPLFEGKRLAYGLGSHHNFEASQLVWEGLGDLPLLDEMGFEIDLVIQERDDPEAHERIGNNLRALGLDLRYRLFNEPAVLAPILEEGAYDVAYLSDFLSDQADRSGVPMVRLGRILPGYGGVADACRLFERALGGDFRARYRRFL